jgi:hypothetical protein
MSFSNLPQELPSFDNFALLSTDMALFTVRKNIHAAVAAACAD